jgi:hypothetical protein
LFEEERIVFTGTGGIIPTPIRSPSPAPSKKEEYTFVFFTMPKVIIPNIASGTARDETVFIM